MEDENVLQLMINSADLVIIGSDLEKWFFNSYSHGYYKYMNIWVPLIGDESLISRKEKGNVYDTHAAAIIRGNVVVGNIPQNIRGLLS